MTVVSFPTLKVEGDWQEKELQLLMQVFARHARSGEASDWRIAATDDADPQFYVLGPAPASECILSISRVRQTYVLEDGSGNLLADGRSLREIADKAARVTFEAKRASVVARMLVLWWVAREAFEEKIEPLMGEPAEVLSEVVPHLAALA
jgi:hypothetical protein